MVQKISSNFENIDFDEASSIIDTKYVYRYICMYV